MKKIVLTGGGTAGHVMPNIALLPTLKKDFDIYYFGNENGIEKKICKDYGINFTNIPCAKLNRSLTLKNLLIPFVLIKGIVSAEKQLKRLSPDVVFSKGGYVSVPTVIAAKRLNIPVIAHESDISIGLANKITSPLCEKVLTSFKETAKTLKNGQYVGSPIREQVYMGKPSIAQKLGIKNKPNLLVLGGSLGSKTINNAIYNNLDTLLCRFNVIHICGKNNVKKIAKENYYQFEYVKNIQDFLAVADIVVSRAGSNACFELLSLYKPTLFIPLSKKASRGDQIDNAKYFSEKGLSCCLFEENLTDKTLIESIEKVYKEKDTLKKNLQKYNIKPANTQICHVLLSYTR